MGLRHSGDKFMKYYQQCHSYLLAESVDQVLKINNNSVFIFFVCSVETFAL